MTPKGVKTRKVRNRYVFILYAPGSSGRIMRQQVAKRPFSEIFAGDVLREGRLRLLVVDVRCRIERRDEIVEHVIEVYTRKKSKPRVRRRVPANVVRMPAGNSSVLTQFIRYHVLIRVYHGDPDAWLADLLARGDTGPDMRFVRWIRSRLRRDPMLIASIRRMVEATPFWRVIGA